MTELVRTGYSRLFEVRVLHHYWLDDGAAVFDSMADPKRTERLLGYDVRRVVAIEPSRSTATAIAEVRGVFRATASGFFVAVPDDTIVGSSDAFEFYLTAVAADFANYTALTLRPRGVVAVRDPADGSVRRYKANVPVLSNLTGEARGTSAKRLFLSQKYAIGGDCVEALLVSGTELRQLTGDSPAEFRVIGQRDAHPVYVHQDDAPVITPPPGATGAPPRGIDALPEVPLDVVAVVRIAAVRADDGDFSVVDSLGRPRTPTRVFEVHFKNRSTLWRYRRKTDGSIDSTETRPLPLTYFGNAGTKQKPSTGAIEIERDSGNPPKITGLVSEIYV